MYIISDIHHSYLFILVPTTVGHLNPVGVLMGTRPLCNAGTCKPSMAMVWYGGDNVKLVHIT